MMNRKIFMATAVVLVVLGIAAFFRFYDITNFPAGLFPDEAANGEDVKLIFNGDFRPFYARNNGREAVFFYIQAAMVKHFGIGVWPLHVAAGIVGLLTVLVMYHATRVWFGRLSGILASLFLATNSWHVTASRTGFRAIMVPFFIALFTWFVGETIQAAKKQQVMRSYVFAALTGISFMGGFYTYIAYRAIVAVVLGVVVLLLVAALHPKIGFPHFKRYGKHVLIAWIAGALIFVPLGWYFMQHPDSFLGRSGQVSVFNRDLQINNSVVQTMLVGTKKTVLSFFTEGDHNWRHNVGGYPLVNPLVGLLFILGVIWAINGTVVVFWEIAKGREVHLGMIYPYMLLLLLAMMLPVITTAEGLPHALRSLGLLVPVFFLAGTAGSVILYWIKTKFQNQIVLRNFVWGAVVAILLGSILYDGSLYFLIARSSSDAYAAYRGDLTVAAEYINAHNTADPKPYLVLDGFSDQTITFLTNTPVHDDGDTSKEALYLYRRLDPENSHLTNLQPGEQIIFTQSSMSDADRYEQIHRSKIKLLKSVKNTFGQEVMRVYAQPAAVEPGATEADLDA